MSATTDAVAQYQRITGLLGRHPYCERQDDASAVRATAREAIDTARSYGGKNTSELAEICRDELAPGGLLEIWSDLIRTADDRPAMVAITGRDIARAQRALQRPAPQPDHAAARAVLSWNATWDDVETLRDFSCED